VLRHELAENDPDGIVLALPDEQATALAGVRLVEVRPYGADTWRLVPLRNQVGAVRVGDLDLVVRPKAPFASLMFMLGYARDPGFVSQEIGGNADDDLWAAVGETLARQTERALLQGVLQGYVRREASLAVLRGRMRTADQVARRPGMLVPLEVTFDEYEVDIPENRILRAALRRMSQIPRLPRGLVTRLRHLAGRLDGVSELVPGAPLPTWVGTRMNQRYQAALRISELILCATGLSTAAGAVPVAAFVVDMAAVFESFVGVTLKEALAQISPRGTTVEQHCAWLDDGSRVRIKPDVVHLVGKEPRIIVDAKYKLGDKEGGYPTADVYQVLAYCTALGLSRGHLVYAGSRAEGAEPVTHRVRNTEIDVVQWPLDVSSAPADLLEQVQTLATGACFTGSTTIARSER